MVATLLFCRASFASYGIWTSDNRSVGFGTVRFPTPFGLGQGATTIIEAPVPVASAADFSQFAYPSAASSANGAQYSYFTPDELHVSATARLEATGSGNIYIVTRTVEHHIEARFHLDGTSPFSFDGRPEPPYYTTPPGFYMQTGVPARLTGPADR